MNRALLSAVVVIWIILVTAVISHGGFHGQNSAEAEALVALVNAERASQGVGVLTENALLDQAAQLKANDMAVKGYYSHTSPEGYLPFHWLDAVGYKYLNVGENLDIQYPGSGTDTNEGVNAAFMNSPEHRQNILLPQFTEIGTGMAQGTYEGESVTFYVELFATPYPLAAYTPPKDSYPVSVPKLPVVVPQISESSSGTSSQAAVLVVSPSVSHTNVHSSAERTSPVPVFTLDAFSKALASFAASFAEVMRPAPIHAALEAP